MYEQTAALVDGGVLMLSPSFTPKQCLRCGKEFTPKYTSMQVACSIACARRYAKSERESREKAEKQQIRARKEKLKSRTKWEDECRAIVQKIARIRDRNDGCISCDLPANWDGQWHGSHYRSHGACSVLQFNLWNINKACWICNKLYSGRIADYKPRLVEKYGQERVDWLDSQNGIFKPPIDYYKKFKRVMGKKLRRMERKAA